jgi:hypothetical protein
MRDRLGDLQVEVIKANKTEEAPPVQKETEKKFTWASKKKGKVEPITDSSAMQNFFEKLEAIKEQITAARFAIMSLNESQQRGLNNTITETQKNGNQYLIRK